MTAPRRTLGRNIAHSLAGQAAPGLMAIVAMPLLLEGYGTDRLGILHLTWLIAGYFSLLDVGIGRALTHAVAAALARRDPRGEGPIVLSGYVLLTGVGIAGGVALWLASGWLAGSVFTMGEALRAEAAAAFRLLALAIPFVTLASGGRGVLEAQQRFELVNAVRIPSGVLMFLAPVAVLPFAHSLLPAVAATVVVRALTAAGYVWLAWRGMSGPNPTWTLARAAVRGLLSFGAWIAAANLTGTITQYADRLVLGSMVSLAAVTYYATPLEVISRLTVVSTALMAVMFPAFSAEYSGDGTRLVSLYAKAISFTLVTLFLPILAIVSFAPELLRWWLGAEFAAAGVFTTRLIAVGTLANALAQAPFGLLQATGRARATALLAAVELPLYALALWLLTRSWGVEGVAVAWAARMVIDAVAHAYLATTGLPGASRVLGPVGGACLAATIALVVPAALEPPGARLAASVIGAAVFAWAASRAVNFAELVARVRSLAG